MADPGLFWTVVKEFLQKYIHPPLQKEGAARPHPITLGSLDCDSDASIMSGAQSQVLILSELQDAIFSALDKQSQSRCARVCKAWADSSLQHLWRELDCVLPLLNLLGEFKVVRSIQADRQTRRIGTFGVRNPMLTCTEFSISQPPTEGHWSRFETYSRLVTVLRISSLSSYDFKPYIMRDNTVYFDATLPGLICCGQKYPRLLPNIHSLRIHLSASDSPSILPLASVLLGSLSSMELVVDIKPSLPATIWTPLKVFLNDTMTQTPGLECFSLKANPGADSAWPRADDPCHSELDKIIREFLAGQAGTLTTLKVNSTMLTTELLELVSKFPQLRSTVLHAKSFTHFPAVAGGNVPETEELIFAHERAIDVYRRCRSKPDP